jgi:hypothetical protein
MFTGRSRTGLQKRARSLSLVASPPKQCAYGLSRGKRCGNTVATSGVTFQKVPNDATVLSHCAIAQGQWRDTLVCCSAHGQDIRRPLSATNLATTAPVPQAPVSFQTPKKRRASTTGKDVPVQGSERTRRKNEERERGAALKIEADARALNKRKREEANALLRDSVRVRYLTQNGTRFDVCV